jgi:predicted O-methyltransferase YrrM
LANDGLTLGQAHVGRWRLSRERERREKAVWHRQVSRGRYRLSAATAWGGGPRGSYSVDNETAPFAQTIAACLTRAAFYMPSLITTSAWLEHAPFASWLISAQRPRSIVELGTHFGFSFCVFCEAVTREYTQTPCTAIDTWKGDEHAGFYNEKVFVGLRQYIQRYPFGRLVRSTFDAAVGGFQDGSIDLLHIDGRHGYNDVRHDFLTWKPKLSDSAIVLFHDTAEKDRGFGVYRFWNDLRAEHPHFTFDHGHGLGVLAVGPNIPASTRPLFLADRRATELIRMAYSTLGAAVSLKNRADLADQRVRHLEAYIENKRALGQR